MILNSHLRVFVQPAGNEASLGQPRQQHFSWHGSVLVHSWNGLVPIRAEWFPNIVSSVASRSSVPHHQTLETCLQITTRCNSKQLTVCFSDWIISGKSYPWYSFATMSCRFGPSTAADQRVSTWTVGAGWFLHQEGPHIWSHHQTSWDWQMVNRHPWSDKLQYLLKIDCCSQSGLTILHEIREWMNINIDQLLEFNGISINPCHLFNNDDIVWPYLTHGPPLVSDPSELLCKAQEPHTLQELQGACQVFGWFLESAHDCWGRITRVITNICI